MTSVDVLTFGRKCQFIPHRGTGAEGGGGGGGLVRELLPQRF